MGHADGLHRRSFGSAAGREWLGVERLGGSAGLEMRAMAVEFPVVHGHPNRLPFEGVLTLVDVASDKAPSGARGASGCADACGCGGCVAEFAGDGCRLQGGMGWA
jgi:hypothetical protein